MQKMKTRRAVKISQNIREKYISKTKYKQSKFANSKFLLLLWKNWLLHKRHPCLLAIVVILPLATFLSMGIFSLAVDDTHHYPNTSFPSVDSLAPLKDFYVAYAPSNQIEVEVTMRLVEQDTIGCTFESFPSGLEMEKALFQLNITNMVGVEFTNVGEDDLPRDLAVTLRFPSELQHPNLYDKIKFWNTHTIHRVDHLGYFYPGMLAELNIAAPDYYKEGFIQLQAKISQIVMQSHYSMNLNLSFHTQKFSYQSSFIDKLFLENGSNIRRVFFLVFLIAIIVEALPFVKEQHKNQHRYYKIVGISTRMNILSWYVTYMIILSGIILVVVLFLNLGFVVGNINDSIIALSDPTLIITFFLLYVSAFVLLNMFIATLVNDPLTMVSIGAVVHYLLYDPFLEDVTINSDTMWNYCLRHLVCHKMFKCGFQLILNKEFDVEGANWTNLFHDKPSPYLCMGHVLITLACNNLLYFVLLMMTDRPSFRYGSCYLKCYRKISNMFEIKVGPEPTFAKFDDFTHENREDDLGPAKIRIRNLFSFKTWRKSRLSGINIKIYSSEIIAVYGPSNSAKSMLLGIICGDYPSKSGSVDITPKRGFKTYKFGYCTSTGILYDELTIREHLFLFNNLQATDTVVYKYQMEFLPNIMFKSSKELQNLAGDLSYDSKKKLCACLGFCGDPDIVLLDEPTQGVSENTRRLIWSLIDVEKLGKTVLITTRNMDEAETLGERICILNHGNQVAFGSPFFLKKITGATYYLTLEKDIGFDVNFVTTLVQHYLPSSRIFYNVNIIVEYLLDNWESRTLCQLLHKLETYRAELYIKHVHVKYLTLEEIFVRVGDGIGEVIRAKTQNIPAYRPLVLPKTSSKRSLKHNMLSNLNLSETFIPMKGHKLRITQWKAILRYVALSIHRSYLVFLLNLLIAACPILILNLYLIAPDPTFNMVPMVFPNPEFQKYIVLLEEPGNNSFKANYTKIAMRLLKNYDCKVVEDIQEYIYKEKKIQNLYETAFGIRMVGNTFIGLYNHKYFHSEAQVISIMFNVMLANIQCSISVTNFPLPRSLNSRIDQSNKVHVTMGQSHGIALSMAISTGLILKWMITERANRTDHLIRFYGASIFNVWMVNKGSALLLYILHTFIIVVIGSYFSLRRNSAESYLENILLVLSFGLFTISAMHVLSYLIKSPNTGFNLSILTVFLCKAHHQHLANVWICGNYYVLVLSIYFLISDSFSTGFVTNVFEWIFFPVPMLSLCNAFDRMDKWYFLQSHCASFLDYCTGHYDSEENCRNISCNVNSICCREYFPNLNFSDLSILYILITNMVLAFVATIISLALDYNIFAKLKYSFKTADVAATEPKDEDEDVIAESRIIRSKFNSISTDYLILARNLRLRRGKQIKIHGISFGIKPGECFTILGAAKSGKTMICDTMIGNGDILSGDVVINGFNLKYDRRNIFELVGYNPDAKSLPRLLKVKELIYALSSLRGIQKKRSYFFAEAMCKELGIEDAINKQIKNLTTSQLQAVTVMIAFIGNPKLLILDSPTRGMDIASKMKVWMILQRQLRCGKGILMTTSSLQECEAMGTKIGLLLNGSFKMIGSMEQMQERQSHCIQIVLKVPENEEHFKHLEAFIAKYFYASLIEHNLGKLTYQVTDASVHQWTSIFSILEHGKSRKLINEYYIGRSNFVMLFVTFTKSERQ